MSKRCHRCGEALTIETRLEAKVAAGPINICLRCIVAAVRELKKEDERHY